MVMSVADFVRYVNAQHILIKHDPEIQALLAPTDSLSEYEEKRSIELANEIIHYATVILNIFENGEMDIPESVVNVQNNSNDVLDALHVIAGLESFDI